MGKIKLYDPDKNNSSFMQFGYLTNKRIYYVYEKRIDKRTKKYGNPRKHKGVMGKYKKNDKTQ
tara:strand:- start:1322 stop:1510 length:189 start_codon:yes stop_codon:yes gene_type:complete